MSAAATLKAALAQNGITLDQLVAMREREARRLPWVGPKRLDAGVMQPPGPSGPGSLLSDK